MEEKLLETIEKVFEYYGFEITHLDIDNRRSASKLIFYDFGVTKDGSKYAVNVKELLSANNIDRTLNMMSSFSADSSYKPLLVLLNVAVSGLRKKV